MYDGHENETFFLIVVSCCLFFYAENCAMYAYQVAVAQIFSAVELVSNYFK